MADKVDKQTAPTTAMNKSTLEIIAANKPVILIYVSSNLYERSKVWLYL